MTGNSLANSFHQIQERIEQACEKAGRSKSEVQLLAVSKKQPLEKLKSAYDLGQRSFGENYWQELKEKKAQLSADIDWHFIGALQRKKLKDIVGEVSLIHSISSREQLLEAEKQCEKKSLTQDVLLQVNIGKEESKSGFLPEELVPLTQVQALKYIKIKGLMCLPPFDENEATKRKYFAQTRELGEQLSDAIGQEPMLSMGTTHDFEWAIMEGAPIVRVGEAVFGPREPTQPQRP